MKLKNKKFLIFIILLIVFLVILSIIINYKNVNFIYNILGINLKSQNEEEIIDIDLQVKKTEGDITKCLLTFTANNEDEKIKSIEYPEEENYIINVNDEEGKQKVAIDYDIYKGKEDRIFKVTTTSGEVIEKSTKYTIHYDVNGGDDINDTTKNGLINTDVSIDETTTREGYTFYGWSTDSNADISEYEGMYRYQEDDEDITLYAVWRKNADNITSDSLIEAVENIHETCQVNFNINNISYDADVIVYNEDLVLDGDTKVKGSILNNKVYEFGNKLTDVAKENQYAKNMTILKIEGDLTIDEGVTLTACASENGYGGPKGLFIYCEENITNNGTISMTARGAYAQGQDVYLFKNASETYEYVPSVGCSGGNAISRNLNSYGPDASDGNNGQTAGSNSRKTGGGGSGKVERGSIANEVRNATSGRGGNGTSYSGGSGGGSNYRRSTKGDTSMNGSSEGGIGGTSFSEGHILYGGVGNPSGDTKKKEGNGTGGLLIIFSNSINDTGKIEANGVGTTYEAGGASGGGSINIFYKDTFESVNNIKANGGSSILINGHGKAGNGGNGSVTIGSIASGTFERE